MGKFCTNCGKELDENADICLNCGVLISKSNKNVASVNTNNTNNTNNTTNNNTNNNTNNKKGLPAWAIVLIVLGSLALVGVLIAVCIGMLFYNTAKSFPVESVENYIKDFAGDPDLEDQGSVGDTLEIDDVEFTLTKVKSYLNIGNNTSGDNSKYLVFFLEVKNDSNLDQLISYLNFQGEVDGEKVYTKLFFDDIDGVSNLNKDVKPGEKVTGYVVFDVPSNWSDFSLHYKKLAGNREIVFNVTNNDNSI